MAPIPKIVAESKFHNRFGLQKTYQEVFKKWLFSWKDVFIITLILPSSNPAVMRSPLARNFALYAWSLNLVIVFLIWFVVGLNTWILNNNSRIIRQKVQNYRIILLWWDTSMAVWRNCSICYTISKLHYKAGYVFPHVAYKNQRDLNPRRHDQIPNKDSTEQNSLTNSSTAKVSPFTWLNKGTSFCSNSWRKIFK